MALAVELGHEVVELRANEIEGKTGARIVEVVNGALLEEEAAQQKNLFGRVGHEAAKHDRGHGTGAFLGEKRGELVSAGGPGGEDGVAGARGWGQVGQRARRTELIAGGAEERVEGLGRGEPREGGEDGKGGTKRERGHNVTTARGHGRGKIKAVP